MPEEDIVATLYDFTVNDMAGQPVALDRYKGKVLLVVNTASKCGFTPQYKGLEALYRKYQDRGLAVLGFPCNQFGAQEPGSEGQIKTFCETRFGVTFPMFAKIEVNGAGRHPLYAFLTGQATAPDGPGDIQWNFAKFLVGKDGAVLARFSPTETPESPAIAAAVEKAL